MIVIYAGTGKGKTCACVGQAVRALGAGLGVAFGQFMKRPDRAGEQRLLATLLGQNFFTAGAGFFRSPSQRPVQREKAVAVLDWARQREAAMLVLDEVLLALERGLLDREEVMPFVEGRRGQDRHLVMSGPHIPDWLLSSADIVTEMLPLRHVHDLGFPPTCGIEF